MKAQKYFGTILTFLMISGCAGRKARTLRLPMSVSSTAALPTREVPPPAPAPVSAAVSATSITPDILTTHPQVESPPELPPAQTRRKPTKRAGHRATKRPQRDIEPSQPPAAPATLVAERGTVQRPAPAEQDGFDPALLLLGTVPVLAVVLWRKSAKQSDGA